MFLLWVLSSSSYARSNLACFYLEERADGVKALHYYQKAAQMGDQRAIKIIVSMEARCSSWSEHALSSSSSSVPFCVPSIRPRVEKPLDISHVMSQNVSQGDVSRSLGDKHWWKQTFSRRDSEVFLKHLPETSALVRPSSIPGSISLSFMKDGVINHSLVKTGDGLFTIADENGGNIAFESMTDVFASLRLKPISLVPSSCPSPPLSSPSVQYSALPPAPVLSSPQCSDYGAPPPGL